MKKELSQIELATLAAALPAGTASERVKLAYGIWFESDPVRAERDFWHDRLETMKAKGEEIDALVTPIIQAATKKAKAKEKATKAGNARWDKERAGTSGERKAAGKTQQVKKRAKS